MESETAVSESESETTVSDSETATSGFTFSMGTQFDSLRDQVFRSFFKRTAILKLKYLKY